MIHLNRKTHLIGCYVIIIVLVTIIILMILVFHLIMFPAINMQCSSYVRI